MKVGNSGGSSMWKKCEVLWVMLMVEIVVMLWCCCRLVLKGEVSGVFMCFIVGR